MSANNESEMKTSMNNIEDKKCWDNPNPSPRIQVIPSDSASLKSESSSICRPLKVGASGAEDNIDGDVYKACETPNDGTIGSRSSRFPTLIQCKSDSTEEKTVCCANLAVNLYNKALESAKRALPHKTKRGAQFPRSFGEDFESMGPEGFNYLDDGQTECSYDYRDIEFNRDSMFRPDVLAQNDDLPITGPSLEPTNLRELQAKYGLPEEADRVQPYKPPQITGNTPNRAPKTTKPSEGKTEVAINKQSDTTTEATDTSTNAIETGIIVKYLFPCNEPQLAPALTATPEPVPSTSSINSDAVPIEPEPIPGPSKISTEEFNPNPSESITKTQVKDLSVKTRPLGVPSNRLSENMDQLAKRTSQLILETAFESIARSKTEGTEGTPTIGGTMEKSYKKSSTESNAKELKKEKKLLEKKLKEEEKNRRKQEKHSKDLERKERKTLFDRFRSEDKQKRKIQKKQKEFEKIKRKLSEKQTKDSAKSDAEGDIEADDEYEPNDGFRERPYEDIDDVENRQKRAENMELSVTENAVQPEAPITESVKVETFENIREIGVTYEPSDDGIENENYSEGKPKSKSGSFRMPRIESFKTKVIGIFPKKSQKTGEKTDKKSVPKSEDTSQSVVPEIVLNSGESQRKTHEYENIDETNAKPGVPAIPSVIVNEANVSQWETEDEERHQFLERVSSVESPKIGAKKRKKSKTRAKLDRIKAKAIESLPNIKSIMPKMRGLVGGSRREETTLYRDFDYESFIADRSRHKYDSDFDCVSDSELCDSLRRKGTLNSTLGRHHVYEEMAATQERVDSYMSPIAGPLRPPRRFSSLKNIQKVASVPSLATQVLLKPKRTPPPRPPPPRPPPPKALPLVTITIDSNSGEYSLKRRPKQKVPPEIYYNNLRMNFKPKRRFVNLKPKHMEVLATYDEPKPPLPVFSKQQIPTVRAMRAETLRRVNQKNALNSALNQSLRSNAIPLKERNDLIIDNQKVVPTPPPRRKRNAKRSQTMDPLEWRPFTWKTGRCRSLTELDVRKEKEVPSRRAHNYENIPPKVIGSRPRTPRPARPPLPSYHYSSSVSLHYFKRFPSDNYHIYAQIPRKGHPNAGRPLPAPPVPPRPTCIKVKESPQQSPVPKTRDVSVSTKDNGLIGVSEKQTQIDARNKSICEDVNGNELHTNRTPTNPTTPTHQTQVMFLQEKRSATTNEDRVLADQCVGLNDSTVTLSSLTTTNWFDAENPPELNAHPYKDNDQDTLNDDISSIASVYQSLCSDVTVTHSREETPVPEPCDEETEPPHEKVIWNSPAPESDVPPERPVTRRSLPSNAKEAEDEEMFGMSRELHSELKNILDKRIHELSSDRPDSTA